MRIAVALAVAAAGCGRAGAPELAGDRAYGAARYAEALAAYRQVPGTAPGRLWAKVGAAGGGAGTGAVWKPLFRPRRR